MDRREPFSLFRNFLEVVFMLDNSVTVSISQERSILRRNRGPKTFKISVSVLQWLQTHGNNHKQKTFQDHASLHCSCLISVRCVCQSALSLCPPSACPAVMKLRWRVCWELFVFSATCSAWGLHHPTTAMTWATMATRHLAARFLRLVWGVYTVLIYRCCRNH